MCVNEAEVVPCEVKRRNELYINLEDFHPVQK